MKKNSSIIKNGIYNIIQSCMSVVFPLVTFTYASRIIGVSGIGKVTYSTSVVSYFALVASLGIALYATREGGKYHDNREELSIFSSEILYINIISTIVSFLLFGVYLYVANPDIPLMLVSGSIIFFNTLKMEWLYQIEEEYKYISIRTVLFQIIALVLLVILVKNENDYISYAFVLVFSAGGSSIMNVIHSKKYIDFKKSCDLNLTKHIKPIFLIFFISLASSIYMNLDNVMLGVMKGDYAVGIYTVSVKVNTLIRTVMTSLNVVFLSRITKYWSNSIQEDYRKLFDRGFNVILALAIPASFGVCAMAKIIILIFAGSNFLTGIFSMRILAINMVFSVVDGYMYYQYFLPQKKEKTAAVITVIGAISNFFMNMLVIPQYSYNGAAVSTVISEFIVFVLMIKYSKLYHSIDNIFAMLIKILIASMPIFILHFILNNIFSNIIIYTLLMIVLSCVVYVFLMYIMKDEIVLSIIKMIRK